MQRRATSWRWSGLLLTSLTTLGLAACVGEIGGGDEADGEGPSIAVEQTLCTEDVDLGPTPLRRITASQFHNIVTELFATASSHNGAFVSDEKIGGFEANVVAPVSDSAVGAYMGAAEAIATEVSANLPAILPCDPVEDGEDACAVTFITELGKRLFRRPLTEDEIDDAKALLFDVAAEDGTFEDGIHWTIAGMLQAPSFLYRPELGVEGNYEGFAPGIRKLTPFELASRLSFFLWNTMPDEPLLEAAQSGGLDTVDGIEVEVRRMLDDPRAADAIARFHVQWLGVDGLVDQSKDDATFTPGLAASMLAETGAFADHVIRQDDAKLQTLLTADYTVADQELASFYGIEDDGQQTVSTAGTARRGLLSHASILASHAHASETSVVLRGLMVRERFLCSKPPPPPEGALEAKVDDRLKDPACKNCHTLMDPIGFGFEGFDEIGREVADVDTAGEVISADVEGAFDGVADLAELLAGSDQVRDCVSEHWLQFSAARELTPADECSIAGIAETFRNSEGDIKELIVALAKAEATRFVRPLETN